MAERGRVGDLTGRTVVVTGASSGIGLAAAIAIAGRGANVALVGRNEARLTAAAASVRDAAGGREPAAYRADFARLADVHVLVDRLRQRYERIDVLANNAGGVVRRGTTADGFGTTIQTNHLAGFLLSNLLREQLRNGRIINTSSGAHSAGGPDPDDFRGTRRPWFGSVYGTSKLANVLFTAEAARRWPDILSASFHPGFVRTRFGASFGLSPFIKIAPFARTPEQGADTLVWLATTPRTQLVSGGYYLDRKQRAPSARARDEALAARLWTASLEAVGLS